jgi:hypothetical protein
MKYFFLSLLVFFLFATLSCQKDAVPIPPTKRPPIQEIIIGSSELADTSYTFVPYIGKTAVVFVDSFGEKLTLNIEPFKRSMGTLTLYKYNVFEQGDTVRYVSSYESYSTHLTNYEQQLDIWLFLKANLSIEKEYHDELNIIFIEGVLGKWGFYLETYPQMSEHLLPPVKLDTYTIFNKTFTLVYKNQYNNAKYKVYYTTTEGIVSFTDKTGKWWRFEKML